MNFKLFITTLLFIILSTFGFGFNLSCKDYVNDDLQLTCTTPMLTEDNGISVYVWDVITYNKITKNIVTERYNRHDDGNWILEREVISNIQLGNNTNITVNNKPIN